MITKTTGFLTSDGTVWASLEEAQGREVFLLAAGSSEPGIVPSDAERFVMANAEALIGILALTPRSKPKARKQPGTTNPKRAAQKAAAPTPVPATPEQASMGFDAMHKAAEAV